MLTYSMRYASLAVLCLTLMVGCSGSPATESTEKAEAPSMPDEQAASRDNDKSGPSNADLDFQSFDEEKPPTRPAEQAAANRPGKAVTRPAGIAKRQGPFEKVTVIDKFPDGRLSYRWQVKRYSDGTMVRHGTYVEFYENGNNFLAGSYQDGEREGKWTYWHLNGQVAKQGEYVHGKTNGKWLVFGPDGLLDRQENYLAGLRDGMWTYYHSDGETILEKKSFTRNKPHGTWTKWYPPGQGPAAELVRKYEARYENGQLHGETNRWYKTGNPSRLENYLQGKPHGTFKAWRREGTLASEIHYENGQPK